METGRHDELWKQLSLEEKVEDLRNDVVSLFSIVEGLSHQEHIFVEALQLVHAKLDHITKAVQKVQKKANEPELTE